MAENQPNAYQSFALVCVSALPAQCRVPARFLSDKNPKHADDAATLQVIALRRPTRYNPDNGKIANFAQERIST